MDIMEMGHVENECKNKIGNGKKTRNECETQKEIGVKDENKNRNEYKR